MLFNDRLYRQVIFSDKLFTCNNFSLHIPNKSLAELGGYCHLLLLLYGTISASNLNSCSVYRRITCRAPNPDIRANPYLCRGPSAHLLRSMFLHLARRPNSGLVPARPSHSMPADVALQHMCQTALLTMLSKTKSLRMLW